MDICIIIAVNLPLLLHGPATQRGLHIAVRILAADHEADLAGRVGRDGGVGVLDGWEDFFAVGF